MRFFKVLSLVLFVGATSLSTGCILRTRGTVAYTVDASPPPPRHVYVDARPGYVWVDGYWYWTGGDWLWMDGYWVDDRPGYVYVQGRWVTHSGRHVWRPGGWRARGTVQVSGSGSGHYRSRGYVRGRRDVVNDGRDHRRDDGGRRHHKRGKRDHRD